MINDLDAIVNDHADAFPDAEDLERCAGDTGAAAIPSQAEVDAACRQIGIHVHKPTKTVPAWQVRHMDRAFIDGAWEIVMCHTTVGTPMFLIEDDGGYGATRVAQFDRLAPVLVEVR